MYVHMCAWCLRAEEDTEHLELELRMVARHHGGARNQTQVLHKNKCS